MILILLIFNNIESLARLAPLVTAICAAWGLNIAKKNLDYKAEEHEASQLVLYYKTIVKHEDAIFTLDNRADYPYFIDEITIKNRNRFKQASINVKISGEEKIPGTDKKVSSTTVWEKSLNSIEPFKINLLKSGSPIDSSAGNQISPNTTYQLSIGCDTNRKIDPIHIFDNICIKIRPGFASYKHARSLKIFIPKSTRRKHMYEWPWGRCINIEF